MGLGGILFQRKHDEPLRVVTYYSRQTSPAEQRYHSYELETLAMVESLDRFRMYVLGKSFKVVTDCNSMRTIMKQKEPIPRVARWILRLQEYDFDIEYRPGASMTHVDALSRNPNDPPRDVDVAGLEGLNIMIDEED